MPKLHQMQGYTIWMMTAKFGGQCATARSTTSMLHEDICFKVENATRYYKVDAQCSRFEGLPDNIFTSPSDRPISRHQASHQLSPRSNGPLVQECHAAENRQFTAISGLNFPKSNMPKCLRIHGLSLPSRPCCFSTVPFFIRGLHPAIRTLSPLEDQWRHLQHEGRAS